MASHETFDLWAEGYDQSVAFSNENDDYPFAGYKKVLGSIYGDVLSAAHRTVLDIGFGTGTLTSRLYENGCVIFGQDFSRKMIELAQPKMPCARLYCGDFSEGLAEELTRQKYDAIISTYALHHVTDAQKIRLIESLIPLLNEHGCLYIGDVAFDTREELEKCRERVGCEWDDDETYFVFEELSKPFPKMTFERLSFCAGVLRLQK